MDFNVVKSDGFNTETVKKSNSLVTAKYNTTIIENKLLALSISKLEKNVFQKRGAIVTIYPNEINKILKKGHNVYRELEKVSSSLVGHHITLEDGQGNFKIFSIITKAEYINHKLELTFNEEIKDHIYNLQSNYTTMNLSVLAEFKKNTSFRIYEILKKEKFKSRITVNDGVVMVSYNINEFRFMIGEANIDEVRIQEHLKKHKNEYINWDYLFEEVAIEKKNKRFNDFKTRVLEPAREELAEKSDICFDYSLNKEGRFYRDITFIIKPNPRYHSNRDFEKTVDEFTSKEFKISSKNRWLQQLSANYEGHNGLTKKDLSIFLEVAENDGDKVIRAINMADLQPQINNYVAWIKSCIINEYAEPIEVVNGSQEIAENYRDLQERVHAEETKNSVWNSIKNKPDFNDFLSFIEFETAEKYEICIPDTSKRINDYVQWKLKG